MSRRQLGLKGRRNDELNAAALLSFVAWVAASAEAPCNVIYER